MAGVGAKGRHALSIEDFSLARAEAPSRLEALAQESKADWLQQFKSIDDIDKPFFLTQESRGDLPPVSEETLERLENLGYPDNVIDSIGSEAEANIYIDAKLEGRQVNGKDALIRTDINYEQADAFGETNLERMAQGRAPLDAQGRPIELHHIGQKPDSPLAELSRAEHREGGNDNVLHNKQKESEIDREDFGKERQGYWKARAEQVRNQA
jgi:hypothetical protein